MDSKPELLMQSFTQVKLPLLLGGHSVLTNRIEMFYVQVWAELFFLTFQKKFKQ